MSNQLRQLQIAVGAMGGIVAVLVIVLISVLATKTNQQDSPLVAPSIGSQIQAVFDKIPANIDRNHVAIIRRELERSTPSGKWEEIEWSAKPLKGYDDVKWVFDDEDVDPSPDNAAQAMAALSEKRWQARENGQPLPEPRGIEIKVPDGIQTSVRIRTANPLGGMSIMHASVQQRGDEVKIKSIMDQSYRTLEQ